MITVITVYWFLVSETFMSFKSSKGRTFMILLKLQRVYFHLLGAKTVWIHLPLTNGLFARLRTLSLSFFKTFIYY